MNNVENLGNEIDELLRNIEKITTKNEEKENYIDKVLGFAKRVNEEYADFIVYKLIAANQNLRTVRDIECLEDNSKAIKNNNFPIKSEYTYGKDKKTVEKLINDAKRVLEYAKDLNPEFFELLKSYLLNQELIIMDNNWYYINRLATYSLEIKEKEGIDLTIDQLMKDPYANTYIYTVVGFPTDENLERYMEALLESSAIYPKLITPSNIDYNMHARAILEKMEPELEYIFSKESEENPNKKK